MRVERGRGMDGRHSANYSLLAALDGWWPPSINIPRLASGAGGILLVLLSIMTVVILEFGNYLGNTLHWICLGSIDDKI